MNVIYEITEKAIKARCDWLGPVNKEGRSSYRTVPSHPRVIRSSSHSCFITVEELAVERLAARSFTTSKDLKISRSPPSRS